MPTMNHRVSIILGSLVGAAAIHVALSACSGGSSSPTPDAHADASGCAQWQVALVFGSPYITSTGKDINGDPSDAGDFGNVGLVPAGWEPIGTAGEAGRLVLRRCVK